MNYARNIREVMKTNMNLKQKLFALVLLLLDAMFYVGLTLHPNDRLFRHLYANVLRDDPKGFKFCFMACKWVPGKNPDFKNAEKKIPNV